jgi:drug/metabolite transporter (DMT)-like permease
MKSSNLNRELIVSYSTFQSLIIPVLALNQLAAAGFGAYVSSYVNTQLGPRRSLTFFFRHFWTMILFLILAIVNKELRFFTKRETPFVLITGILGVFLKAQLTSKSRGVSGPYYLSLWQPLTPVFVQAAVIFLGMEKSSPRKLLGIVICSLAVLSFIIKYTFDHTLDNVFITYLFMVLQIILPGIGSVTTKKALVADKIGVLNLCFWVNVFGTLSAFIYYSFHYIKDPIPPFISYTYQLDLLNAGGIWVCLVFVDTFNLACLTYITQIGDVSKAAVYGTLSATWTIVFGLIRSEYELWIVFYITAILVGYSLIK